jgi:hypothetical protein
MSSADKFEIFIRICLNTSLILFILRIFSIITISYWIVFAPIILLFAILINILSKNAG